MHTDVKKSLADRMGIGNFDGKEDRMAPRRSGRLGEVW